MQSFELEYMIIETQTMSPLILQTLSSHIILKEIIVVCGFPLKWEYPSDFQSV